MKAATRAVGGHSDLQYIVTSFSSLFPLPLMQVPGSQTSISFVKHVPSTCPSSLEPPNVLSTAPALLVTQPDKESSFREIYQEHSTRSLVIFLPLSNEFTVSPGKIQAFTDRKDRRNACTYKICLVKFPASTSSFMLELSQSGSVRVQGPDTGS